MSSVKEERYKPRLYAGVWHRKRLRRRRCCAYAPSNIAIYDNHEKINSWVLFAFLYEHGTPIGGPVLSHVSSANVSGFTMIVERINLVLLPMVNLIQPKSTKRESRKFEMTFNGSLL